MCSLFRYALPVTLGLAVPGIVFAADTRAMIQPPAASSGPGVRIETGWDGFALITFGVWSHHVPERPTRQLQPKLISPAHPMRSKEMVDSFRRTIYLPHVAAAERQYGLPPGLLDALIWTESRYNPVALSKAGAVGLGQLMPGTAMSVGVGNRYDARANVLGAAQYLRQMLDQFGMVHLAVAAYNAGPKAVERAGGIPRNRETPGYVDRVLRLWRM